MTDGGDELVGNFLPRRRPRRPTGSSKCAPSASTSARVGLGDAIPALVAVHGVVAAADGGDAHAARQRGRIRAMSSGAGARRRVAAVGEGMQHRRDAGRVQRLRQRHGVLLVRMHAAGRNQAEQVAGAVRCLQFVDQIGQRAALGDRCRPPIASPIRTSSCSPRGRRRCSCARPRSCPSVRRAGRHRGRRYAGSACGHDCHSR